MVVPHLTIVCQQEAGIIERLGRSSRAPAARGHSS